jgi:hypothetical protein
LAAWMEAKRWMSIKWSMKCEARWKGQQVVKEMAKSEGGAAEGRASTIEEGAEWQRKSSAVEKARTWLLLRLQAKGRPKVADKREGKQWAEGKGLRAKKPGSRTKKEVGAAGGAADRKMAIG